MTVGFAVHYHKPGSVSPREAGSSIVTTYQFVVAQLGWARSAPALLYELPYGTLRVADVELSR